MLRLLKLAYIFAGIVCIAYYFVLGLASRFGLSMSWMWPVIGAVLIGAGILCDREISERIRWGWRGLLIAGLIAVTALEGLVVSGMTQQAHANMDYLIILGARVDPDGPSPALVRRLNAAVEYLEDSPDTIIIASGGQGSDEPMSEGQCIRDELVKRGIESDRILVEDKSTDTAENIAFSMALMEDASASVGVITNNFHVYRAEKLARGAGLENARGIAAVYTGYTLFHYMIRESICITVDFLRGNF